MDASMLAYSHQACQAEGRHKNSLDRDSDYLTCSRLWVEVDSGAAAKRGGKDRVQSQEHELLLHEDRNLTLTVHRTLCIQSYSSSLSCPIQAQHSLSEHGRAIIHIEIQIQT